MPYNPLAAVLASGCFPEEVQLIVEQVALQQKNLRSHLAQSPYLTESTWWKLYTANPLPPLHTARGLISRPLTPAQVEHIATVEKRSSLMTELMARYPISPAAQQRLTHGHGLSQCSMEQLFAAPWATPDAKRGVAYKMLGLAMLTWLATATTDECPLDEALHLVKTYPQWGKPQHGSTSHRKSLIHDILEHRPELLSGAAELGTTVNSHSVWPVAAASSRHIGPEVINQLLVKNTVRPIARYQNGRQDEPRNINTMTLLCALIENPAVSTEQAKIAIESASVLPGQALYLSSGLRRALRVRKRIDTIVGNVGKKSALAPSADSITDNAIRVDWESVSDPAVIKLLVGIRGNVLDQYHTAALSRNPNLDAVSAERIATRLSARNFYYVRSPFLTTARAAFIANYPLVAAPYADSWRGPWKRQYPNYETTVSPIPAYLGSYAKGASFHQRTQNQLVIAPNTSPPDSYSLPLGTIPGVTWDMRDQVYTGIAVYMAKRLGHNQDAWTLALALADQFVSSDLDSLIDSCLKLT